MANSNFRIVVVAVALFVAACSASETDTHTPIKVEISRTDDGYQLLRGGQPYRINGAGMGIDDIAHFASRGGNSIRNWSTNSAEQDTMQLLDAASENGVTVALCLEIVPERRGFDYDDADAVAAQLIAMRAEVVKYKDHPALLAWIVGNELNHDYHNPAVYDAVNDVAAMIHELDPLHPVTTTIAGFDQDVVDLVLTRAPELDFISFQSYGGIFDFRDYIEESGFDRPFMVTEWGAIGFWEVDETAWGSPIEFNSSEKADVFSRAHRDVIAPLTGSGLIGSYVFLWGQKQERTPTWFGMFTSSGEATEVVNVMEALWTGETSANRAPHIQSMELDGKVATQSVTLAGGRQYDAEIVASDPDNDALGYRWELKPESTATTGGGDFEAAIPNVEGFLSSTSDAAVRLTAPPPGEYRLFVYVYDGRNHAAHGNIPFLVTAE